MPQSQAGYGQAQDPALMADLSHAERFIVWSFRRWLLGLRDNNARHWAFVWYEFDAQLGDLDGKAALANFAKLTKELQCHALKTIHHHQPCCPYLGDDEAGIIQLVAACQGGHRQVARSLARSMVQSTACNAMLEAGERLAYLMHRHALHLPHRSTGCAGHTERHAGSGEARTLH